MFEMNVLLTRDTQLLWKH